LETSINNKSSRGIDLPPPKTEIGVWGWLYKNLFSSWYNTLFTLFGILLIYWLIPPLIEWSFLKADWVGDSREACSREGACWVFIKVWFGQLMYGRYPIEMRWRIDIAYIILAVSILSLFIPKFRHKHWVGVFLFIGFPVIAYFLFVGGSFGLEHVETTRWGGLFLTLVIGILGIVGSLPFGIVLALGRRSEMPVIRTLSIAFIELWRGVPLITVLFMSSVMFPLFMPEGVNFDKLARAIGGVMLFSAAYMAEVVRGGLQAIPQGQYEAAKALGLGYWRRMGLIIMPQALRIVIPGIVSTFIGVFKDTTLVLIIGLFDFLGMSQAAITNTNWLGFATESYVFTAVGFWIFCFGMSRYSMAVEKKMHVAYKK